ncbi:cupin domain-containing protein [Streptomyces sp. cg40]|uniref:cupin domain-containing protein n=1 Tax=Streptomyces sp. cg40 TaxID=3419764 RepID=UPI003D051A79
MGSTDGHGAHGYREGTGPRTPADVEVRFVPEGTSVMTVLGEPERVIKAGETFWEPGGEVIHYRNGSATSDTPAEYVVVVLGAPGEPMLALVDEEELERRARLRAPRPPAD